MVHARPGETASGMEHICQKSPFGNLNIYGCRFFTERSFVIVKAFHLS